MTLEEEAQKLIDLACSQSLPIIIIYPSEEKYIKMLQNIGEEEIIPCLIKIIQSLEQFYQIPMKEEIPQ